VPFLRPVQALALAALAATPAYSADVTLGARTELWYDDNVLGTANDEIGDGELLITPKLELSERWGTVEGKLNFKPNYELFFTEKDLRGFNYAADGSLAWNPTPRTSFELKDSFWRYRSLRLLTSGATPGGTPVEAGARDRYTRNVAEIVATHRLTRIDVLQFSGSFALWDFSDRFDQQTFGATASYQHYISPTVSLGAGASYSRLSFERLGAIPERDTDYVNVSMTASYEPADTLLVRLSAGPAYIQQGRVTAPSLVRGQLYRFSGNDILVGLVPSTCPALPTGELYDGPGCNLTGIDPIAQSSLYSLLIARSIDSIPIVGGARGNDEYTYFADVSLERKWDEASLSLGYRRDEGSESSAGAATVADSVELRGWVRPFRELTLSAAVLWENREETQTSARFVSILDTVPAGGSLPAIDNLVPVALRALNGASSNRNVESITTYANASYRLGARASLEAALSWRDQNASVGTSFGDYERFAIMLGVNVELEPLRW
jgi:hypothetical protein